MANASLLKVDGGGSKKNPDRGSANWASCGMSNPLNDDVDAGVTIVYEVRKGHNRYAAYAGKGCGATR